MSQKKETAIAPARQEQDPFGALRQITAELDRVFHDPLGFGRSAFR